MKKILFSASLALALFACSGSDDPNPTPLGTSSVTPSSSSGNDISSSSSSSSDVTASSSSGDNTLSSSSSDVTASSSSIDDTPIFACVMTATAGTKNMPISPAPTATCDGHPVTSGGLTWIPGNYIPVVAGPLVVSVTANLGPCQGMTAECPSITVHEPTLTCNMTATTGKVGLHIDPAPTVSCSGSPVTTGLTWTPANHTPHAAGNVEVSVTVENGVCAGKTAECGNITVEDEGLYETKQGFSPNGWYEYRPDALYLKKKPKDNDGNDYEAVLIGDQVWMAENLRVNVEGSVCRDLETSTAKIIECDNHPYGRVYNWNMIMDEEESSNFNPSGVRGICPDGWHLPSKVEWDILVEFAKETASTMGLTGTEGYILHSLLKSKKSYLDGDGYGWHNNSGGEDNFGFSVLPGGDLTATGNFSTTHNAASFWYATQSATNANGAMNRSFSAASSQENALVQKTTLRSVRCVKDPD